jgi:hypothetical protein
VNGWEHDCQITFDVDQGEAAKSGFNFQQNVGKVESMPDRSTRSRTHFRTLLRWLRGSNASKLELGYFGKAPIDWLTRDLKLCASELHNLTTLGPEHTDLLLLRMTALDLDPEEVCQTVPETCQVLRRVCSICDNHAACARDFTRNPSGSEWKEYCPNTGTLTVLHDLPWASRAEP